MFDGQFFIGLAIGASFTFVYAALIAIRLYHPIIRAQQRQIDEAKGKRAKNS